MCLTNPTKDGIDKLPKEGVYYKAMRKRDDGSFRSIIFYAYKWIKGMNVVPCMDQGTERTGNLSSSLHIVAGAHFFRKKEDAMTCMFAGDVMVRFRIKRSDIEWIGASRTLSENPMMPTVTSCKARLIEEVSS